MPKTFEINKKNIRERFQLASDAGKILMLMSEQNLGISTSFKIVYPSINHLLALRQYHVSATSYKCPEYSIWAYLDPNITNELRGKSFFSLHISELNAGTQFKIVGAYSRTRALSIFETNFQNTIICEEPAQTFKPWSNFSDMADFFSLA